MPDLLLGWKLDDLHDQEAVKDQATNQA